MARINIDDTIFKDARFINLCIALGSKANALGALACLWVEAQKHYLKIGEIPNKDWVKENLSEELIKCGLAERTLTGVIAKGQDEHFSWLRKCSESGKKTHPNKQKNLKQNTEGTFDDPPKVPRPQPKGKEHIPLLIPLPLDTLILKTTAEEKNSCHPKADWSELFKIYNANCGSLPKAKGWNKKREIAAAQRWKELHDLESWADVVRFYASSPHHTGSNDRGWVASFDFILQPGRWLQALENKNLKPKTMNKAQQRDDANRESAEEYMRMLQNEQGEL